VGESQETHLWEDNRKEAGGQSDVTSLFFSTGFPGRSIWTEPPPRNPGFAWVTVGLCASCSHSPSRTCSNPTAPAQRLGSRRDWERQNNIQPIRKFGYKTSPHSQKKLFCFMGWSPSASAASQRAKAFSSHAPDSPLGSVFLVACLLTTPLFPSSVFYTLGSPAY